MNSNLETKENIKEKIIDAASEIFAEKGYQNTTIRDICQKADIYQLSINYHFGCKENLFKEVLIKTYEDTEEIVVREKIKNLPPEKQLEEIIKTRVSSIFNQGKQGRYFKISAKELSNNFDLINEIMNPFLTTHINFIKEVFSNISNNKLDEFELNYCAYLLISHISAFCIHYKATLFVFETTEPTNDQLEMFVEQVKTFVLGGVEKLINQKG